MNIEFELDYLSLLAAAERSPALANEATVLALGKSAREVQVLARAKHRFRSSPKANLEKSIEYEVDAAKMEATVSPNESVAPYALFVHDGTKPHQILPRAKKALRWTSGGKFVFASVLLTTIAFQTFRMNVNFLVNTACRMHAISFFHTDIRDRHIFI